MPDTSVPVADVRSDGDCAISVLAASFASDALPVTMDALTTVVPSASLVVRLIARASSDSVRARPARNAACCSGVSMLPETVKSTCSTVMYAAPGLSGGGDGGGKDGGGDGGGDGGEGGGGEGGSVKHSMQPAQSSTCAHLCSHVCELSIAHHSAHSLTLSTRK